MSVDVEQALEALLPGQLLVQLLEQGPALGQGGAQLGLLVGVVWAGG